METLFELLSAICCVLFCLVHVISNWFSNRNINKQITKLCDKCGQSVSDDDESLDLTNTPLSDEQITALVAFIQSLERDSNGNPKR